MISADEGWDTRRRLKAAALVGMFLLVSFIGLFWASPVLHRWIAFRTVTTDATETLTQLLPDGTLATMGPESSLRYPKTMTLGSGVGFRDVWASGDVSLIVRSPEDSTKPLPLPRRFAVETDEAWIYARDARFQVKSLGGATEIWVHEGSLAVSKRRYSENDSYGPSRDVTAPGYARVTATQVYVVNRVQP